MMNNMMLKALFLWCALTGVSFALVVNVDVEGSGHTTYSGQGAYADAGNDYWNSSLAGMADLTASDGTTVTTIDVTISAGGRHGYTLSSDLMSDYSYSRDVDTTVAISGLTPYGNYVLYVYCQGDQLNQTATVMFGSDSVSTTGDVSGNLVEGGNYAVVAATADANGDITGTVARNGSAYAAVNGLQIVYTGQGTAPPSSSVINVDLGGASVGTAGDGDDRTGTPFTGQGAWSDPGNNYWNNTITTGSRSLSSLIASDGSTVTGIDVTVSGGGGFEDTAKTNYLLSDYFYGQSTAAITGLDPERSYTVYVYACGDQSGQGSGVTVNGVTKSTSNSGDPDTYSLSVNYVTFETTADILGRITIYCDEKLNGFQLIEGDPVQTGYEAEDAVYSGLSVISEPNASGDQCLDGFDAVGDYVEYQNVESGNTLIIAYANGANTTRCSVYVGGTDVATAYFASTGSGSDFGSVILSVDIPTNGTVRLQLDADDDAYNGGLPCAIQDKIDIETEGGLVVVDSIIDLLAQLGKDNVNVKMEPGVYSLAKTDKTNGLIPSPTFFEFSGSGSTYDFTDVTLNVDTDLYNEYGSVEIIIVTVTGDNNHIFGLTQKDIGDELLSKNVLNFRVVGDYNTIEEVSIYTRSSFPYGYGDLFGKGSGAVIGHRKHSALLVNGVGTHLLNCFIDMKTYGHGIFMQGSVDTLVEGCHLMGETSTTDAVLAEEGSGSPADNVDFITVDGWRVPPGYAFSCQEDGIRCYNNATLPDGTTRDTANTTVKNCTIERMRSGVTIGFSNGDNYVSGCTAIGVEGSYWPGNGDTIVNCQAEAAYGPIINNPYANDGSQQYSVTVLRENDVIGQEQMTYIAGNNHEITLLNSGIQPRATVQTNQMGGMKVGMRYVEFVTNRNDYALSSTTLYNWTDQVVVMDPKSSNCDVFSFGAVIDNGSGNAVGSISPATITSSVSNGTEYNTLDANAGTWWSAAGDGEWIQYDLGMIRDIYSVSIQWLNGSAVSYAFDLQVAANPASPWTTVYSGANRGVTDGFEEYNFMTQYARYIRVTGHGNSVDGTIAIVDLEVDLKDRFAMVKTKSDAGAAYVAQNTLDGDLNTRWAAEGIGQWIQYDLLATKTIDAVSLAWHGGTTRTYSFEIGVSDHPMGPWTTVYSNQSSGATTELEKYEFPPVSGRFIRVTGYGNSQDDWINITEVCLHSGPAVDKHYQSWAERSGVGNADAHIMSNPEGDSLLNLSEYALDGDPLINDSREILPHAVIPLQASVVEYTYRRRIDAAERGLSYAVETTDDLTNPGSWSAAAVTEVDAVPLDSEFEMVTLNTAVGTQGFIRLEILLDIQ